ncbi:MAG TPA: hypothetical protein VF428_08090 [Casimicrobiaceae bacterium]
MHTHIGANDMDTLHSDVLVHVADAPGAGGCGDAGLVQPADAVALDSQSLHAAARRHRSRVIGALVASVIRGIAGRVRGWHERYRRDVDARAIHRELAALDDRVLRDLGIHHWTELSFLAQQLARGDDLHELRARH